MTDDRERWALILGASSGMGEATALTLAKAGYRICGIHLDFRAGLAHVEEIKAAIEAAGSESIYINMNAADDEKRSTRSANASSGRGRRVRSRTSASSCTRSRSGRLCRSSMPTPRPRSIARGWR
jgi:NAD(P)-dependent dehydrogenase (short-subunit alcohol dehydrogenase family)